MMPEPLEEIFEFNKGLTFCYDAATDCINYKPLPASNVNYPSCECIALSDTRFTDNYGKRRPCPFYKSKFNANKKVKNMLHKKKTDRINAELQIIKQYHKNFGGAMASWEIDKMQYWRKGRTVYLINTYLKSSD